MPLPQERRLRGPQECAGAVIDYNDLINHACVMKPPKTLNDGAQRASGSLNTLRCREGRTVKAGKPLAL